MRGFLIAGVGSMSRSTTSVRDRRSIEFETTSGLLPKCWRTLVQELGMRDGCTSPLWQTD